MSFDDSGDLHVEAHGIEQPRHVGLILDGNRRWAKEQGIPQLQGHKKGYENLKDIVTHAHDLGIPYVSAFVFSTENWHRSKEEVRYLMKLLEWVVTHEIEELHERGGRLVWMGSLEHMQPKLVNQIRLAEEKTARNTGGTLALCLNHGGHREITEACRQMVQDNVSATDITESKIASYIDHPEVPPLDLIIRTSGEQRLSNFMLWRAAYSELVFRDTFWPAFSRKDFDDCLLEYTQRKRRFGG